MERAAIYINIPPYPIYSQHPRRLAEEAMVLAFAERQGYRVVASFADTTLLDATQREGLRQLFAEARRAHFGAVVVPDSRQLTTTFALFWDVYQRLHLFGVEVVTAIPNPLWSQAVRLLEHRVVDAS